MVEAGDFSYNSDKARILIKQAVEKNPYKKAYVISDECMSGHVYSGFNAKRNAERIANIFPNAKVFFVIRNQISYICSAYANYIFEGGSKRFNFWIRDYEYPIKSIIEKLQYHYTIKFYQDLFGKSNVLVLPFEILKNEKMSGMINNFCKFMEIPGLSPSNEELINKSRLNSSFSMNTTAFLRLINGVRGGCTLNQRRVAKVLDTLIPRQMWQLNIYKNFDQNVIADYFKKSNTESSMLIGYDLSHYGYPT